MARGNNQILLRIGDLAEHCGLELTTLKHWVDKELIPAVRKKNKLRYFDAEEGLKRVRRIQQLKEAGKTLDEIKSILDRTSRKRPA